MKLPNPKPADRDKIAAAISNYEKLRRWMETGPSEAEILATLVVEHGRPSGARHAILQRLEAAYIAIKKVELNTAIAGLK